MCQIRTERKRKHMKNALKRIEERIRLTIHRLEEEEKDDSIG